MVQLLDTELIRFVCERVRFLGHRVCLLSQTLNLEQDPSLILQFVKGRSVPFEVIPQGGVRSRQGLRDGL